MRRDIFVWRMRRSRIARRKRAYLHIKKDVRLNVFFFMQIARKARRMRSIGAQIKLIIFCCFIFDAPEEHQRFDGGDDVHIFGNLVNRVAYVLLGCEECAFFNNR